MRACVRACCSFSSFYHRCFIRSDSAAPSLMGLIRPPLPLGLLTNAEKSEENMHFFCLFFFGTDCTEPKIRLCDLRRRINQAKRRGGKNPRAHDEIGQIKSTGAFLPLLLLLLH